MRREPDMDSDCLDCGVERVVSNILSGGLYIARCGLPGESILNHAGKKTYVRKSRIIQKVKAKHVGGRFETLIRERRQSRNLYSLLLPLIRLISQLSRPLPPPILILSHILEDSEYIIPGPRLTER